MAINVYQDSRGIQVSKFNGQLVLQVGNSRFLTNRLCVRPRGRCLGASLRPAAKVDTPACKQNWETKHHTLAAEQ